EHPVAAGSHASLAVDVALVVKGLWPGLPPGQSGTQHHSCTNLENPEKNGNQSPHFAPLGVHSTRRSAPGRGKPLPASILLPWEAQEKGEMRLVAGTPYPVRGLPDRIVRDSPRRDRSGDCIRQDPYAHPRHGVHGTVVPAIH